jgi:uncharacterized membrane protein YfcA
MISGWEIIGLAISAAAGGAINAVAGGGTLVTFPTLLAFGMSPIRANATSTLALVIGTGGGTFGNRKHVGAVKPWLRRFVPVSLLGGFLGSVLLTHTTNQTFARLVPFLILFATLLFLAQGAVGRFRALNVKRGDAAIRGAIVFQFAVAVYGGYFGAGAGILMLAALGFVGMENIYEMNTLKMILGFLINITAALWFIASGLIDWPRAGIMTIGAVAGYYLGAHFSQRISPARVRQLVTAIGFVISAVTFYQQFIHIAR